MADPPHEPTRHVLPAAQDQGRGDAAPPEPPRELDAAPAVEHAFSGDGEAWVARLAGKGACGTGSYGLGLVEAVHFFRAAEPARPVREALLARGRFPALYGAEVEALWRAATPIVTSGGN